MSKKITIDEQYNTWIKELSTRYKTSQIKAAMAVNSQMLMFYWSLGRDMDAIKDNYKWGSHFYSQISRDINDQIPNVKSFSPRNLLYMHQFYRLFPQAIIDEVEITKQSVSQFESVNTKQPVSQLARIQKIFLIPWGHLVQIINKFADDQEKALFYVEKTLENNWSRAVLLNFLDTDLYERAGKAITNFANTLPAADGDLAQAITRDPYNFDFITIREKHDEKELKDALMDNIEKFLLELGNGFAFIGREVRIDMGDSDEYMDMLFYNIKLHCYVVVEVKVEAFKPRDMGQLGTYMVAVNHLYKKDNDAPTLGLIICKSKNNVKAQYALEASSQPMGISEYDITNFMPEDFKSSLPTIEEIEAELGGE